MTSGDWAAAVAVALIVLAGTFIHALWEESRGGRGGDPWEW